jgi:hypothetical protein
VTILSFDLLPRISRAQYMDALSSQATVSGYRAALKGASHFDRFFPLLTTAAGTIRPAKVLVMGVGVAGLQAISTAKRLGAKVRAYDVRSAAKEEAESAGAVFVKLGVTADAAGRLRARADRRGATGQQQAALLSEVANSDVVITTAAVPGRKSPILVTTAMVEAMGEGSLVIDMAADGGGNCELTKVGEVVEHHGVRIVGMANPPAEMGASASFMYANNVLKLLASSDRRGSSPGLERRSRHRRHRRARRRVNHASRRPRRWARARRDRPRSEGERLMHNVLLQYATVLILTAFVGHRDHRQGAEHPAHAADERIERDPRRHPGRLDAHPRASDHEPARGPRLPRGDPRHAERRGRLRRHRPHARDVQAPRGQGQRAPTPTR